jgi:ubiquinone/menaquinone biosynthesis C-methylase UbiE
LLKASNLSKNDYKEPSVFWDQRFSQHGHTGYKDPLYHSYTQPLRLKAVKTVMQKLEIPMTNDWQVLEVGCGSGDFLEAFAGAGACVTGIDISERQVNWTKKRFSKKSNVKVEVGTVEELNLPDNSFDMVLSVNVLQHIVKSTGFENAVRNLVRVTKQGGCILIFEISPGKNCKVKPVSYIFVRMRDKWINFFEMSGCRLVYELPFPELGIRFIERFDLLLNKYYEKAQRYSAPKQAVEGPQPSRRNHISIKTLVRQTILRLSSPLDNFFISLPYPREASVMRILLFKKSS